LKVTKLKSQRPDYNPLVNISFSGTMCLANGISRATKKLGYSTEDEFLRSVCRKAITDAGCYELMEEKE
jgi:hypothetical protein